MSTAIKTIGQCAVKMVHDFWAYCMTFGEFQAVTVVFKVFATANKNGVTSHVMLQMMIGYLLLVMF